jgi:cytochrome c oxidase subunit 4
MDQEKPSPSPAKPPEEKAAAERAEEKALAARGAAYRQGLSVLIGLAVLTALEFVVASILEGSTVFLFVLALAKAGLILQYYMHLDNVWSEEEAH